MSFRYYRWSFSECLAPLSAGCGIVYWSTGYRSCNVLRTIRLKVAPNLKERHLDANLSRWDDNKCNLLSLGFITGCGCQTQRKCWRRHLSYRPRSCPRQLSFADLKNKAPPGAIPLSLECDFRLVWTHVQNAIHMLSANTSLRLFSYHTGMAPLM
jgi:hypothetical protein